MVKGKVILNHDMIKIVFTGAEYRAFLTIQEGGEVEHQPFPGNQMGLVAAMTMAVDVLAGKFWLKSYNTKAPGWTAPTSVMLPAPSYEDAINAGRRAAGDPNAPRREK